MCVCTRYYHNCVLLLWERAFAGDPTTVCLGSFNGVCIRSDNLMCINIGPPGLIRTGLISMI